MKKSIQKLSVFMLAALLTIGLVTSSVLAESNPTVSYCTHVQNVGWQDYASNGTMSGTEGRGLRLEGIKIKLDTQGYDLGISYQTHIQNIGWEADTSRGWKADDSMSGTEGLGYRLEAIQIKLTGADADKFDIYYQVHAQNMGWLGLAKSGESAGTAGYGYRLEGIRIEIVPAGSTAPSWTVDKEDPFYENPVSKYPSIKTEIEKLNWKNDYVGQLYYFYEDLTNDGIPELIIGRQESPWNSFKFVPYAGKYNHEVAIIYQLKDGSPVRVLGRDRTIRGHYHLDANNYIIDFGTGGAQYHGWSYYKLDGYDLNFIESVHLDTSNGENYTLRDVNGYLLKNLSKTDAYTIFDKYSIKTDIDWLPLVIQ